jgi:uncharacterized protein YqgC (DUF456 family)
MDLGQIALPLVTLGVMLFGLFGLAIIILPGLVIIWAAALGYGALHGMTSGGWLVLAFITILMLIGSFIDNIIMGASARKTGASWWSVLAAVILGFIGSFALPPVGGVVFALGGLFFSEYARLKDWRAALTSTRSMAVGCGWAFVLRFAIGLVMIALWIIWVLWVT